MSAQPLFTHKRSTPMHDLRFYLDQFTAIPLVRVTKLSKQREKHTFIGDEEFHRREINFDHVMLYHLRDSEESVSFNFRYEGVETATVRATVRMGKDHGVEYSREYSVEEARNHLKDFLATYLEVDHRIKSKHRGVASRAFAQAFASHFGVTLSEKRTPGEIKSIKIDFLLRYEGLGKKVKDIADQVAKVKASPDRFSDSSCASLRKLFDEQDLLISEMSTMRIYSLYDVPSAARKIILETIKKHETVK